ncbi:MAG: hypothetical protein GX589_00975 [Deltaproteobacteria bacterium]|nr:hypothetical protein [Deltaproteobacteria bacterium]
MNWEIPDQPVDSYQIRYGFSENQLDSEITLKVSELETFEDPVHGPAYRYYLHEIDPEQTLYLTISAFHADEKSEESKVYKISPE